MTPQTPGPPVRPSLSGWMVAPTDLRTRAHARLAERIDLTRSRHKPMSLLRAEAKRVLEQFYDIESVTLTRAERDRLVEDTIAASIGFSPLEELYRDESVREILVLGVGQVLTRKGEAWLPVNARFRDTSQLRAALSWLSELGETVVPNTHPAGGLDVKLPNGFRLIAVIPPEVLNQPPLALFVRGGVTAVAAPSSGIFAGITTSPTGSGSAATTPKPVSPPPPPPPPATPSTTRMSTGDSGVIGRPTPTSGPPSGVRMGPLSGVNADPIGRVKQRVTERLISQLAAAGVYDLSKIAPAEMRKIILAYVAEQASIDRLGLDDVAQERLAIEILTGMTR
ncbi:MAG: hypothetical protein ACRC7O_11320 [Fimbriiglobus sp.]